MASNFESSTLLKGSDFSCTSCKADNYYNEAQHFCKDCKKYFCDNCLTYHAKILRDHTVYGRKDKAKWDGNSETCATHVKGVEAFCEDHQELCCSDCVDINHRSCKKIRYILEVARRFHDTPEYKLLPDVLKNIHETLDRVKHYKEKHQQDVQGARKEIRAKIKTVREDINTLLDDIEKTTLEHLDANVDEIVTKDDDDIRKCEQADDTLTVLYDLMQSEKREKSSFIQYHKFQNEVKRAEGTIHDMCFLKVNKHLAFEPDNNLRNLICEVKMFGQFKDKDAIKPDHTFKLMICTAKFNVKSKEDTRSCRVVGICELPSGELLIADQLNEKVKLLNTQYRLIAQLSILAMPFGVCNIVNNEVAVVVNKFRGHNSEVHFYMVTNGRIKLKRKFPVRHECVSIAHNQRQLYVESSRAIYLYKMNGNLVKKIYEDTSGHVNFLVCNHMALSDDGSTLYRTNYNTNELISIDFLRYKISTFSDPQLSFPEGVHVSEGGHVFVCGRDSHTIMQVDKEGRRKLALLAEREDGVFRPLSLCFSCRTSSLIVGQLGNNLVVLKLE